MHVIYGSRRPVEVRVHKLWQLERGAWRPRDVSPAIVVVEPDGTRPRRDLFDVLDPGLYFAAVSANGQLECHMFSEHSRASCQDLMIEPEPGKLTICGERGAENIPDPVALLPECARGGYVWLDEPASGSGKAVGYLEDGAISAVVDYRDGLANGVRAQHMLASGHRYRVDTDMVDGKEHGLRRAYDEQGRLIDESSWFEGKRHGIKRRFGPNGEVLEEWHWDNGRAMEIRVWDLQHRLIEYADHRPDGLAHGTFCRPDHHCSAW